MVRSRATFIEWTRCLPESEWQAFITEVLDPYQAVAADSLQEMKHLQVLPDGSRADARTAAKRACSVTRKSNP